MAIRRPLSIPALAVLVAGGLLLAAQPAWSSSLPSVSSLSPAHGYTAGGTRVTVHGSNFSHVTSVHFGAATGSAIHIVSTSALTVTAPGHPAGTVDVRVTTTTGSSTTSAADRFTYLQTPVTSLAVLGVTATSVALHWGNPADPTFAGVTIRRLVGTTAPSSPTVGTLVSQLSKTISTYTNAGLVPGTHYAYAVFAHDASGHYATPAKTATKTMLWGSSAPADPSHGAPSSVSCPSPDFCAAVDQFGDALTFDGSTNVWATPVKLYPNGAFSSISCPTASFCVAVGAAGKADTLTGSTWGPLTQLGTSDDFIAVSCTSSTSCLAVDAAGSAYQLQGTTWSSPQSIDPGHRPTALSCAVTLCAVVDDASQALTFDGATWTTHSSVGGTGGFSSVSCTSATFCLALDVNGAYVTYNGSAWTSPTNATGGISVVSCVSSAFCLAVDADGRSRTYTGTWSQPQELDPVPALSCASTTFCLALSFEGVSETFNGASWSGSVAIADLYTVPAGLSCTSATFCALVDSAGGVLTYNGTTWSAPTNLGYDVLTGVSCTSPTFCVAVGGQDIFVFNGSTWSLSFGGGGITAVSCASSTFCVTVDDRGRVDQFDGTRWSSPGGIDFDTPLNAVSCATPTRCVAIDSASRALVFNGTSWSSPEYVDGSQYLRAVSCVHGGSCFVSDGAGRALAFNGSTWTAPVSIVSTGGFSALSCTSSAFCYGLTSVGVVGFTLTGSKTANPLTTSGPPLLLSCVAGPVCLEIDSDGNARRAT
jgi:hypothetical protein